MPLAEVADKIRVVPPDCTALLAALAVGTSFGSRELPPPHMGCAIR